MIHSLETISSRSKLYPRLPIAIPITLLPLLTRYFMPSLDKVFLNNLCMEVNILFILLKLNHSKSLSCITYVETLPRVVNYVCTGLRLVCVVFCFCLCMKLEGQICNHYLRAGSSRRIVMRMGHCVCGAQVLFFKSEGFVSMWKDDAEKELLLG